MAAKRRKTRKNERAFFACSAPFCGQKPAFDMGSIVALHRQRSRARFAVHAFTRRRHRRRYTSESVPDFLSSR
jgi:hypothetical protein